jgi:AcrR family transcriptional regulator
MPSRPLVDERRDSIAGVALTLLAEGGTEAVTMKAVAERTGLSRPAIYQYFASSSHILSELVVNEMADLVNALDEVVAKIEDPLERIRVWVHYSLAHMASEDHGLIKQISKQHLPADQRGLIGALHGHLMAMVVEPLEELQVEDAPSLCGLIYGTVAAAADRIGEGSSFLTEAKLLEGFLEAGLRHYTSDNHAPDRTPEG